MTVLPELSFQEISQYFHLPISQAAKELKVCETLLKKICRVNGIKRWPHRKIRSIDTMINLLEFRLQSEKLSEKEKNRMRNEIVDLIEKKSFFMNSPNTTYQSIIPKNTLQSFSKTKLKNQKSFSQFLNEEAKNPNSNLLTHHNSLFSTFNNEGNSEGISSMIVTNLRSKTRRNKPKLNDEYEFDDQIHFDHNNNQKMIEEDGDDDSDYIDQDDPDFHINIMNNSNINNNKKKSNKKNNKKEISIKEKINKKFEEKNNNENLEEEEEEVLNVLYSLSKEKQKSDQNPDQILINNENNNLIGEKNDHKNDQVDDNNNNGNELYKLSLIAILNPMMDDNYKNNNDNNNDNNNNNSNNNIEIKMKENNNEKENKRVNQLKKRNFLRRSSENFDQNLSSDIKRRKFDYEFSSNLQFSSDPNNSNNSNNNSNNDNNNFNQLIKL